MQEIAHHVLGNLAVRLDEEVADVAEDDPVPVVQFVERLVYLEGLAPLGAEVLPEREDAQEEDFGLGQLLAEFLNHGGHSFQDLPGRVVLVGDVVDANEDDRGFWFQSIEIAVVQAPEDMLGVVTADAEVEGMAGCVILILLKNPAPTFCAGGEPLVALSV